MAPRAVDFEAAEHPALHPGRCARVLLDGRPIGYVGELHPQWRQSWGLTVVPILFELALDAVTSRDVPVFASFSKHQAVERDIAVWVAESVSHADVMTALHSAPHQGLLKQAVLFDIYRPSKPDTAVAALEKSMAIRLTLQRDDAGLNEQDIDAAVAVLLDSLSQRTGARLRA